MKGKGTENRVMRAPLTTADAMSRAQYEAIIRHGQAITITHLMLGVLMVIPKQADATVEALVTNGRRLLDGQLGGVPQSTEPPSGEVALDQDAWNVVQRFVANDDGNLHADLTVWIQHLVSQPECSELAKELQLDELNHRLTIVAEPHSPR